MAIITQRLLIIFILINMFVGIAFEIQNNPHSYNLDRLNTEIDVGDERNEILNKNQSKFGNSLTQSNTQQTPGIGDTLTVGGMVWDAFLSGLDPWSIRASLFNTAIEKIIATIIMFFRSLLLILIGLEIWNVIIARTKGT